MPKKSAKSSPYSNREMSWVKFNERVLEEAIDPDNPLLERLKFLAIVSSNFDEFFMVRMAAMIHEVREGNLTICPSGLAPSEIIEKLNKDIELIYQKQSACYKDLRTQLAREKIKIVKIADCNDQQQDYLKTLFENEIFPVLTPLATDNSLPLSGRLSSYVAFLIRAKNARENETKLAIVQIPAIDRFRRIPDKKATVLVSIEDLIIDSADHLFPGHQIIEHGVFNITRNTDAGVDEDRNKDFINAMKEVLQDREKSNLVRVEFSDMGRALRTRLLGLLDQQHLCVYDVDAPLGLSDLMSICSMDTYAHLSNEEWLPQATVEIPDDESIWEILKEKDVLLHHPYQSFDPVLRLLDEAGSDPNVISIKMTLYRTSGSNSPIVKSLIQAAQNGKHVSVLLELKARFDEQQNIKWAEKLEDAGVIVVYGIAGLKVHAKALLIVRKEESGVIRYAHMGTGNYNEKTAKLYTDMGLFTSNDEITYELVQFFNAITGYSSAPSLSKLAMAPLGIRSKLTQLINREIDRHKSAGNGLIIAKMNSLVDLGIIDLLYQASSAGVKIKLNVRGICCLKPGIKGLSKNIEVYSIIDRYLEHNRIFYFYNGGHEEIYLSSADWMERNIDKRVELLFPINDPTCKKKAKDALDAYFKDNTKSHRLNEDGSYDKIKAKKGQKKFQSQKKFHLQALAQSENKALQDKKEFKVRRK
ncbi:MAG: polyphosphate kinase 1 [Lentisphaeria bacterium]|nr:polyphosphate kinase 1 [Lentisphaeria bacterium]NQZ71293.1 polyphosphate kinase 1 [Lentisphaeria bacterium]